MGFILVLVGILTIILGVFIGATSVRSDIQLGLVFTAVIGGLILIGIGNLTSHVKELLRRTDSPSSQRKDRYGRAD